MEYTDLDIEKMKGYAEENEPSAVEQLMAYYGSKAHFDEKLFLKYGEQGVKLRIPRCNLAVVAYAMREWGLDTKLSPEQLDLLESAADTECLEAIDLYVRYIVHNGINRDTPKVIRLSKLLLEDRRYMNSALHAIAHLSLSGCFGIEDIEVGLHYLILSGIEHNHDDALLALRLNFQNGIKWKISETERKMLMDTLREDDAEALAVWSMLSALRSGVTDCAPELENLKRRATEGYAECVLLLARLYLNGVLVKKDTKEAYRLVKEAGLTTDPRALLIMVALYLRGESPLFDIDEGWMNLMWGYEDDTPRFPALAAAILFLGGKEVCPYDLDLKELLEKGIEQGDVLASSFLMACHTFGWEGYEENRDLALSRYNPLSEDQHDLLGVWLYALNGGKGWQGLWNEAVGWQDQSRELRELMRRGGDLYQEMEEGFVLGEYHWTLRFLEEALYRYWL